MKQLITCYYGSVVAEEFRIIVEELLYTETKMCTQENVFEFQQYCGEQAAMAGIGYVIPALEEKSVFFWVECHFGEATEAQNAIYLNAYCRSLSLLCSTYEQAAALFEKASKESKFKKWNCQVVCNFFSKKEILICSHLVTKHLQRKALAAERSRAEIQFATESWQTLRIIKKLN